MEDDTGPSGTGDCEDEDEADEEEETVLGKVSLPPKKTKGSNSGKAGKGGRPLVVAEGSSSGFIMVDFDFRFLLFLTISFPS